MPQQILKPDDERKTEAALPRFVYDFENVDRRRPFLQRPHLDVAGAVDREITGAPAIDVVGGDGGFNVPLGLHFSSQRRRTAERIFNQRAEHASLVAQNLANFTSRDRDRAT